MVYCLEKRAEQAQGKSLHPVWIRYAICSNRALLERVRMGQPHPKNWRVTLDNAGGSYSEPALMKKAG